MNSLALLNAAEMHRRKSVYATENYLFHKKDRIQSRNVTMTKIEHFYRLATSKVMLRSKTSQKRAILRRAAPSSLSTAPRAVMRRLTPRFADLTRAAGTALRSGRCRPSQLRTPDAPTTP